MRKRKFFPHAGLISVEKEINCSKICPEWPCTRTQEYRGVWVVGEAFEEGLSEPSLQMLSPARSIADKLGTWVEAVLLGSSEDKLRPYAEEMIKHGADRARLLVGRQLETYLPVTYARVIARSAATHKPEIIFFAATMRGREIAPYVANTLRTGITADCTQFDVDEETGDLLMIRPPFAAILLAYIKTPSRRPQISTARPNVFPPPPRDEARKGEIIVEHVGAEDNPHMRLLRVEKVGRSGVPLEKAEYIVAGGRGVGTPEGFSMLEELAEILGGVVAGSRKAVDMGLVSYERQVGQTGKSVRAKLYIAVGISGAAQHVIGIRECRIVVAVNKDPDAPIFRHADYGIVGRWEDIIPLLIERFRERCSSSCT